jgi:hypothetical protein
VKAPPSNGASMSHAVRQHGPIEEMKMKTNKADSRKVNPRAFKRAFQKAIDQLHKPGTRLCQMHSRGGSVWFLVPGIVDDDVAQKLIAMPNVRGNSDGLFPHQPQTWQVVSTTSTAAA